MFQDLHAALKYIQDGRIQMVDLKYCDLWGSWHHVTLPASQFGESTMTDGIGFDGSSVGLRSVMSGDMVLIPDLSTGFRDPFWELPTLSFICNIQEADSLEPCANDPRAIAQSAEAYLRETAIADESRWGPEFEFYVFDRASFQNGINFAGYRLDCCEAEWNTGEADGQSATRHGGYHAIAPLDRLQDLRSAIAAHLIGMGVPIKYHHHEGGSAGQCELETPMLGLVRAGDAGMLIKYVTRLSALGEGKAATFMPKPLFNEAGSGMHFHQHLFKDGRNLFYNSDGYGHLSDTALWYIGGLLQHGPALLAFTDPSTNSYRRLVPGFEAPVNAFFSLGNRSAAVRIPKYASRPESTRIEFRPPDATCNVYLALAAQLLAGLDGIARRIEPTTAGFGPIDDDIFSWTEQRRRTIRQLPTSLEAALECLKQDHEFLCAGGVFTDELIDRWIEHKLNDESFQVRSRPHPYEMTLYF